MAKWITQNNVYEATYWEYESSLLSRSSNPNSFAAFVSDFGPGRAPASGRGLDDDDHEPECTTTTTTTVPPTTTTTTTVSGNTGNTGNTGGSGNTGNTGNTGSGGSGGPGSGGGEWRRPCRSRT